MQLKQRRKKDKAPPDPAPAAAPVGGIDTAVVLKHARRLTLITVVCSLPYVVQQGTCGSTCVRGCCGRAYRSTGSANFDRRHAVRGHDADERVVAGARGRVGHDVGLGVRACARRHGELDPRAALHAGRPSPESTAVSQAARVDGLHPAALAAGVELLVPIALLGDVLAARCFSIVLREWGCALRGVHVGGSTFRRRRCARAAPRPRSTWCRARRRCALLQVRHPLAVISSLVVVLRRPTRGARLARHLPPRALRHGLPSGATWEGAPASGGRLVLALYRGDARRRAAALQNRGRRRVRCAPRGLRRRRGGGYVARPPAHRRAVDAKRAPPPRRPPPGRRGRRAARQPAQPRPPQRDAGRPPAAAQGLLAKRMVLLSRRLGYELAESRARRPA